MTLELPYPPTVNHYLTRTRRGYTLTARARAYRAEVCALAKAQKVTNFGPHRLEVVLHIHPPDRRKRDLDNLAKSVLDALQHAGVFEDDSQIDRLTLLRCPPLPGGRVVAGVEAKKR